MLHKISQSCTFAFRTWLEIQALAYYYYYYYWDNIILGLRFCDFFSQFQLINSFILSILFWHIINWTQLDHPNKIPYTCPHVHIFMIFNLHSLGNNRVFNCSFYISSGSFVCLTSIYTNNVVCFYFQSWIWSFDQWIWNGMSSLYD